MATTYKNFDLQNDIVTKRIPEVNTLVTITSSTNALTSDVSIYSIGGTSGFVTKPDASGSVVSNISMSGAMNGLTKFFFDRFSNAYYDATNNVYSFPHSENINLSTSFAKLIEIRRPTLSDGIWAGTLTAVLQYGTTSVTAVDSMVNSLGPNKQSLTYGSLVDSLTPSNIIGTIFYTYGVILFHGGTGNVYSQMLLNSGDNFYFGNNVVATSSLTATAMQLKSLSFSTYTINISNIYFCRMGNAEFNYSSNPSAAGVAFLQDPNNATTYVTAIALLDNKNNILAVSKISPPAKKNRFKELNFSISLSL